MGKMERTFKLRLWAEAQESEANGHRHGVMIGELWHGNCRVPVAGTMTFQGRVDAVITFYVDQFLFDDIFQPGDTLVVASERADSGVFLVQKPVLP